MHKVVDLIRRPIYMSVRWRSQYGGMGLVPPLRSKISLWIGQNPV